MVHARLVFRVHAVVRMFGHGISEQEIRDTLRDGETIARYPDDTPYPSRLVLGWPGGRPLHVVVADNARENEMIVVTVHEPDPALWTTDFRRRKP